MVSSSAPGQRLVGVAVVLVVLLVALRLQDRTIHVGHYRLVDDRTLAIDVAGGSATWTRIGSVTESADAVVIDVRELRAPLPGAGGQLRWLVVHLAEPLGSRTVIDAATRLPLAQGGAICETRTQPGG